MPSNVYGSLQGRRQAGSRQLEARGVDVDFNAEANDEWQDRAASLPATATRYPLPAARYPLPAIATRYPLPATRYRLAPRCVQVSDASWLPLVF